MFFFKLIFFSEMFFRLLWLQVWFFLIFYVKKAQTLIPPQAENKSLKKTTYKKNHNEFLLIVDIPCSSIEQGARVERPINNTFQRLDIKTTRSRNVACFLVRLLIATTNDGNFRDQKKRDTPAIATLGFSQAALAVRSSFRRDPNHKRPDRAS
jgi:hypothetical protein